MKKSRFFIILSFIIVLTLLVGTLFACDFFANDGQDDNENGGQSTDDTDGDKSSGKDKTDNDVDGMMLEYHTEIDAYTIKDYRGTDSEITIPEKYHMRKIVGINEYAFRGSVGLTTINFSKEILTIGVGAFLECKDLVAINVPDKNLAFSSRDGILLSKKGDVLIHYPIGKSEEEFTIPNGVKELGDYSLKDATFVAVNCNEELKNICSNVFSNCANLTEINFNSGLEVIGESAFENCVLLKNINLPKSTNAVKERAFYGCSILEKITVDSENTSFVSDNGILFTYDRSELVYYPLGKTDTEYEIPDTVTTIGAYAFSDNEKLTKITFNEGIEKINSHAFFACKKLTNVNLPDTVTNIGAYAFSNCLSLVGINVGKSLTEVGEYAFNRCEILSSIILPDTIQFVDRDVFRNCSELKSITIGKSISSFGHEAFVNCDKLNIVNFTGTADQWSVIRFADEKSNPTYFAKKINIDGELLESLILKEVTRVHCYTFVNCECITSIIFPDTLTEIGESSFDGCKNVEYIKFKSDPKFLDEKAFNNVDKVTTAVIPALEEYAFNVKNLTTVTLFGGNLGKVKFKSMPNLTDLTLSYGYTEIKSGELANCGLVTTLTLLSSIVKIEADVFSEFNSLEEVNYKGSIDKWAEIEFDTLLSNPVAKAKNILIGGNKVTKINLNDTLTKVNPYAFAGFIDVTEVVIPDTVKSIGSSAFYYCNSIISMTLPFVGGQDTLLNIPSEKTLFGYIFGQDEYEDGDKVLQKFSEQDIVTYYVPETLTSITITGGKMQYGAFSNLYMINEVVLEDGVTNLSEGAFLHCTSLFRVTVGDGIDAINKDAFYGCSYLDSITLGASVKEFGENSLFGCVSLKNYIVSEDNETFSSIDGNLYSKDARTLIRYANGKTDEDFTVGDNVIQISEEAFYNANNLVTLHTGKNVVLIGKSAFRSCEKLKEVTIGNDVTTLSGWVFYGCTLLEKITFGQSIQFIGEFAFGSCESLTSITIPNTVTTMGNSVFSGCVLLETVMLSNQITSIGSFCFYGCSSLSLINVPCLLDSIGEKAFFQCTSLTAIHYAGKKNDWYTLPKEETWDEDLPDYVIYCTDGEISVSKN